MNIAGIAIPPRVRRNDPINADDYNMLLDAVEKCLKLTAANRIKPSADIGIRSSSSDGTLLFQKRRGAAGGSSPEVIGDLQIIASQPRHAPPPETAVADSARRYWLTWGTIGAENSSPRIPSNAAAFWDVPNATQWTYFFAEATVTQTGDFKVQSVEIKTGAEIDEHETEEWPSANERPEKIIVLLGWVWHPVGGSPIIHNEGEGSIRLYQTVIDVAAGDDYQEALVHRRILALRLGTQLEP